MKVPNESVHARPVFLAAGGEPQMSVRPNNAMHQTRRGGAAGFLRRRPIVEARLAGDCECCAVPGGMEIWRSD